MGHYLPSVLSFLLQSFFFLFWTTCSAHTSTQCFFLNLRIKVGSLVIERQYQDHTKRGKSCPYHSSDAIPRSLQHRINALLLHPSDAVGRPVISKKSCSPLAWDTNLHSYGQLFLLFSLLPNTQSTFHDKRVHILEKYSSCWWNDRHVVQDPNLRARLNIHCPSTNIGTYHQDQMLCLRYGDIWFLGGTTSHLHNKHKSYCCCTIVSPSVIIPGVISTSSGAIGSCSTSAISLGKGCVDKPWKDRDQSWALEASWNGWSNESLAGKGPTLLSTSSLAAAMVALSTLAAWMSSFLTLSSFFTDVFGLIRTVRVVETNDRCS